MRRTLMVVVALAGLMIAAPRVADARVARVVWFPRRVDLHPRRRRSRSRRRRTITPRPRTTPRRRSIVAPRYWGRPYPYYGYGPRYRAWPGPPGWYKHGYKHGLVQARPLVAGVRFTAAADRSSVTGDAGTLGWG